MLTILPWYQLPLRARVISGRAGKDDVQGMGCDPMDVDVSCKPTPAKTTSSSKLPDGFQPCDDDILCGRGKRGCDTRGNRNLCVAIQQHLLLYGAAMTKQDKSAIIDNILDRVRSEGHSRFVTLKNDSWFEISEEQAREKIAYCLREAIAHVVSAQDRVHAATLFETKQAQLLSKQKAIFESMMRNHHKKKTRFRRGKEKTMGRCFEDSLLA